VTKAVISQPVRKPFVIAQKGTKNSVQFVKLEIVKLGLKLEPKWKTWLADFDCNYWRAQVSYFKPKLWTRI